MDRKYSDGTIWENSINWDDASDGSEGGYDRHGNYIVQAAMEELVKLRKKNDELSQEISRLKLVVGFA